MKFLLIFLLIFVLLNIFYGNLLLANEGGGAEVKPESEMSSSTKKAFRKVGRKVRDESCELTEDKAKCEKEKIEHLKANAADRIDTKKRKMDQATREYEEELKR